MIHYVQQCTIKRLIERSITHSSIIIDGCSNTSSYRCLMMMPLKSESDHYCSAAEDEACHFKGLALTDTSRLSVLGQQPTTPAPPPPPHNRSDAPPQSMCNVLGGALNVYFHYRGSLSNRSYRIQSLCPEQSYRENSCCHFSKM